VVQGAAGHACFLGDALRPHRREALGAEQASGHGDQRGAGLRRPLALSPSPAWSAA